MTKIQKVLRDIQNLQDFYKRTLLLRTRIKKKGLELLKVEQANESDSESKNSAKESLSKGIKYD
jgi:hypothetical protein